MGYFLKLSTSENRTTEIHRSQGPGVQRCIFRNYLIPWWLAKRNDHFGLCTKPKHNVVMHEECEKITRDYLKTYIVYVCMLSPTKRVGLWLEGRLIDSMYTYVLQICTKENILTLCLPFSSAWPRIMIHNPILLCTYFLEVQNELLVIVNLTYRYSFLLFYLRITKLLKVLT